MGLAPSVIFSNVILRTSPKALRDHRWGRLFPPTPVPSEARNLPPHLHREFRNRKTGRSANGTPLLCGVGFYGARRDSTGDRDCRVLVFIGAVNDRLARDGRGGPRGGSG